MNRARYFARLDTLGSMLCFGLACGLYVVGCFTRNTFLVAQATFLLVMAGA